jgi:hypothetical protein
MGILGLSIVASERNTAGSPSALSRARSLTIEMLAAR